MAIDATDLIIKIISGGAVGYLTNFLAFKVLFKKKRADNYRQIINSTGSQLKKNKIKPNLENFLEYLFDKSIPENIPDKTLGEIPGIDKTIINLNDFLIENRYLLEQLNLELLFKQINLEDIINNEQINAFSNKIYNILNMAIGGELKNLLTGLYDELQDKKLSEIILEGELDKLIGNVSLILDNFHTKLPQFDQEIGETITELLNVIDLNSILGHFEENLKKKTLLDIIGPENIDAVTKEFIEHFIIFINTDEGKNFLNGISKVILELARDIDSPLLNFLNPVLQVKMFVFLERNIPYLAETAKEWLRINKQELEHLVENTIEEYYSTQNVWGQVKLAIKDILGLKISEYFGIVEKGIERLENYVKNHATEELTREVVKFLENKKLGTLITELNIETEKLSGFFHNLIKEYLPRLNISIFSSLFEKQLGNIAGLFKLDLNTMFQDKINEFLLKQIKYQFLYNSNFTKSLQELVSKNIGSIKDSKVYDLLSRTKMEEYIGYLPILLMFSRGKLVSKLEEAIQAQVSGTKVSDILDEKLKESLNSGIMNVSEIEISKITEQFKEIYLRDLKLNSAENSIGNSFSHINHPKTKVFKEILEPLFSKNIENAIISDFNKLSRNQLKESVSGLLEKENSTLILASTFIGTVTGAALYFGQGTFHSNQLVIPVTYSLLGIGTYLLSLKMLLQPYHKKQLLGISLPFTPGVVPKRKSEFAEKIGNLVSGIFKTKEFQETIFDESIINETKVSISANNYEVLNKIILDNHQKTTNQILEKLVDQLLNDYVFKSDRLAVNISTRIDNFELNKISEDFFERYFNKAIKKSEALLNNFLNNKAQDYRGKTLKSLPAKLITSLNNIFSQQIKLKIDDIFPLIKSNVLEEKASSSLQQLDTVINYDTKLELFMSFDPSGNFKEKIISYLESNIRDKVRDGIEKFIQNSFMEDELAPDKEIGSLFKGELVHFIKRHMFTAFDSLIFGIAIEKLKAEKEKITAKIIKDLRETNKDSFIYGLGESILNIEGDIREIIHLIIDNKLEPYLKDKKWELENILTGFLELVSRKKLFEIGITEDVINSENVGQVIDNFLKNEHILEGIHFLSEALLKDISGFELGFLLNLIGINSLKDIPGKLNKEIIMAKEELYNNLSLNKETIVEKTAKFSERLLDKFIWSIPVKDLLESISDNNIAETIENIGNTLYSSGTLKTYKKKIAENIYKNLVELKAGEIINISTLQKSLNSTLEQLGKDEGFKAEMAEIIKPLTLKIIENFNLISTSDTKDFIVEILSQSIFNCLTVKTSELLYELNIKEIVEKEVNNLTDEQLEDLLDFVSKPQLNKIIIAGLLGTIVGILAEIIN